MFSEKKLINQLQDYFAKESRRTLKQQGILVCRPELERLQGSLNSTFHLACVQQQLFSECHENGLDELEQVFKSVIDAIDQEESLIEKEMAGVQNFSEYELSKIKALAHKKDLKAILLKMLQVINQSAQSYPLKSLPY